jgi:hypothetical protein
MMIFSVYHIKRVKREVASSDTTHILCLMKIRAEKLLERDRDRQTDGCSGNMEPQTCFSF